MRRKASPNPVGKDHADGRGRKARLALPSSTCSTLDEKTPWGVLIAIEPRAYSQTIGYTVRALRPRYAVATVDPDLLGGEVERRSPDLVLCSLPHPITLGEGPTWVEFRPYAQPGEQIIINGQKLTLESVEFADLLSILDEAESSLRCA